MNIPPHNIGLKKLSNVKLQGTWGGGEYPYFSGIHRFLSLEGVGVSNFDSPIKHYSTNQR